MNTDDIVDLMNEALAADPAAVTALVEHRVPCRRAVVDHPTIVCAGGSGDAASLGLLGLLNGIAGRDNDVIEAVYADGGPHAVELVAFRARRRPFVGRPLYLVGAYAGLGVLIACGPPSRGVALALLATLLLRVVRDDLIAWLARGTPRPGEGGGPPP